MAALQEDDRVSLAKLSESLGVPSSTLSDRIKRLQRQGVIAGFQARLSPEAMGLDLLAFVLVSWTDPATEARFLDSVTGHPSVLEVHHVTGNWNYLVKVRVRTTRDYEHFLNRVIKSVQGVQKTETLIALSTQKETWALNLPS